MYKDNCFCVTEIERKDKNYLAQIEWNNIPIFHRDLWNESWKMVDKKAQANCF